MVKSSIQVFIENFVASSLSVLKIILQSKLNVKLPSDELKECVILGNGPSLNDFLENHNTFLKGKRKIAVNNFNRTDAFDSIKPEYYVITSPLHFVRDSISGWHEDRMKTFKIMNEKTHWDMTLFVPELARNVSEWKSYLKGNDHIKVCYFNNTPVEGFNTFKHFCFKRNLGMPRPHNVLIPSLMIALNIGFKKIYVTGADHGWTKELFVTEENEVLLSQKHFYDKQATEETTNKNKPDPKPMYQGATGEKRKLHEVLIKFYYSFQAYWEIRDFADKLNSKIMNITPGSFIDAFDRKSLKR